MKRILLLLVCFFCLTSSLSAQEVVNSVDFDEIEISVKSVRLSAKGDSVTVALLLHSYLKNPRELKINTFATGIVNPEGKVLFYDSMSIGKVKITLVDRENYIHYLLKRNEPVLFTVKTPSWPKRWGKPQQFRLTLEDHMEEGKFLQVDVSL